MKLLTPLLVAAAAFFAPGQEPEAPRLNLSTHDVADILALAVDDLQAEDPESAAKLRADRLKDLLADIDLHMEPFMENPSETVRAVGDGNLVALLNPAQEAWLEQFLAAQRSGHATLFDVQTRLSWVPLDIAAKLGLGTAPRVLEAEELLALRAELELHDTATSRTGLPITMRADVSMPRIAIANGKRARLATLDEQHFVTGYRTYESVAPSGGPLVVPQVTTVAYGDHIDMRCVILPGNAISMDFRLRSDRAQLPLIVEESPEGPVARPRTATCTAEANLVLPGPAAVLIGGLERDGHLQFALVDVRPIAPR